MYKPTDYYHDQYGMHPVFRHFDGNVGIGTESPTEKLEVFGKIKAQGSNIAWASVSGFIINDTTGHADSREWGIYGGAAKSGALVFRVGASQGASSGELGATMMLIDKEGKVGIGETAPSTILDVKEGSATDPVADAWDTHSSREIKVNIAETEPDPDFNIKTYQYHIKDKAGNVHPDQRLHYGVMAEDVPEMVRGKSGKGLDLAAYTTFVYTLVKKLKVELDEAKARIAVLEGQVK